MILVASACVSSSTSNPDIDTSPTRSQSLNESDEEPDAPQKTCTRWYYSPIYIRFGPNQVNPDTRNTDELNALTNMLALLVRSGTSKIVVSGYSFRESQQGKALGMARAELVRDTLIERGIPPSLLEVTGSAEPAPFYRNDLTGETANVAPEDVRIVSTKALVNRSGMRCRETPEE